MQPSWLELAGNSNSDIEISSPMPLWLWQGVFQQGPARHWSPNPTSSTHHINTHGPQHIDNLKWCALMLSSWSSLQLAAGAPKWPQISLSLSSHKRLIRCCSQGTPGNYMSTHVTACQSLARNVNMWEWWNTPKTAPVVTEGLSMEVAPWLVLLPGVQVSDRSFLHLHKLASFDLALFRLR